MSGGTISANESTFGGGIYVANNSLTLSGGTIKTNTATSYGGAIDIHNDGTTTGTGTIYIKGSVSIPAGNSSGVTGAGKNDVYLGNVLNISDDLDGTGTVATITPYEYQIGMQVLAADTTALISGNYDRFKVTPQTSQTWTIDENGLLAKDMSGNGTIEILTADGKLTLTASATKITSNTSDTTITITGTTTPAGGTLSGWSISAYYNGTDLLGASTNNTYKILKSYPNGYYSLVVNVTYNGVTYSDTFTIQKAVP